jgi:hypothetical protein
MDLYEGPLCVLEDLEAILRVEEDPLVKDVLERRAAMRKAHEAMAAGEKVG